MQESLSWEANSHSDSQGIPRLLWNPKVHYRVHKSQSLISILIQTHSIHNSLPYFPKINFNINFTFTSNSSAWFLPFRFSGLNFVGFAHLSHARYMPHPTQPPFDKAYNLWSSSLCSLLQPPATSSLLGSILLSTLFPNIPNLCPSLSVRDQVSHPYKKTGKIIVLFIHLKVLREEMGRQNILNWMISNIPRI